VAKVEAAMAKKFEQSLHPTSDLSEEELRVQEQYWEAHRRCREAFVTETGDPHIVGAVMMDGRWHARLQHFIEQVREEGDLALASNNDPEPQDGPEDDVSGLTSLVQDKDDHLSKLSRYETSLTNALTRTLGLLSLLQAKDKGCVIEGVAVPVTSYQKLASK
jgi:hypothetical protein